MRALERVPSIACLRLRHRRNIERDGSECGRARRATLIPIIIARAARYRLPPGGSIFIHGTPGAGARFERDWTDGCIAVSNRAIEEIWDLVDVGTPVEIRP